MLILVWKKKIRKERKNICVFLNIGQKRIRNLQRWNDTVIFFCQEVTALRDCGYHAVSTHEQGTGHHPYRVHFFRKFSRHSTAFQKVFQTEYSFSESFPLQSTIFQIVFHIEYSFSECFPATIIMKFSKQITVFQKVFQTDHSFSESFPDREQFFWMFNI